MITISMSVKEIETKIWQILGSCGASGGNGKARWDYLKRIIDSINESTTPANVTIELHTYITTFPQTRYTATIEVTALLFELLDVEEPTPDILCFGLFIDRYGNKASYALALKEVNNKVAELQEQIRSPVSVCS